MSLATRDYKEWGHDLIDRLVELGLTRNGVYKRLAKKMHLPLEQTHFGSTNDDARLYMMVRALQEMVTSAEKHATTIAFQKLTKKTAQEKRETKQKRKSYKIVFTDKATLRSVGIRNGMRGKPWRQRVIPTLHLALIKCGIL